VLETVATWASVSVQVLVQELVQESEQGSAPGLASGLELELELASVLVLGAVLELEVVAVEAVAEEVDCTYLRQHHTVVEVGQQHS
jgi:hypothetical protein